MPMDQFITAEIPILEGDDHKIVKRLRKARKRLENIFKALDVIGDVITVCEGTLEAHNTETDVVNILRRYASNALFVQMERLTKVVVKLGGETEFSYQRSGGHDTVTA